jgi:maltokinase
VTTAYAEHLAAYLDRQRWFAGKGRHFDVTSVHPLPWLPASAGDGDGPRFRIEVVTVEFGDGSRDTYQLPTAYLPAADPDLGHALVGEIDDADVGSSVVYDAVYLKPAAERLFDGFLHREHGGSLDFEVVEGADLPQPAPPGSVMTAEQSNTSIAYGDDAILKLYRRISAGSNPDIEVHAALTRLGCEHVAPLLGWLRGRWQDDDGSSSEGHLGMLQVFLRTATDGWSLALASVRDLFVEEDLHPDEVGGDFAAESERLGEATALVHHDLAAAFGTATMDAEALRELSTAMLARLDAAVVAVPELADVSAGVARRFEAVAELPVGRALQRVHGDLHLGQTLRTVKNWKIIDFEGEPAKTLAERVALDSPLRDVAGMLRSFDYAAASSLKEFGPTPQLSYRAEEWTSRNQHAFLAGYAGVTGQDPAEHRVLLGAYEADKAVYEVVYETRNRPAWVTIPLRSVARLAGEA